MTYDAIEMANRASLWNEARRRAWQYGRPAPPEWVRHDDWLWLTDDERAAWMKQTRDAMRSK